MLGIFSGKSDHPLVDPKSARELYDRLNRSDPLDVVDEIDSWLESTSSDLQIKRQRRVDVMFQLDDIGSMAATKLAKEYLLLSESGHGQNYRIWQGNSKYWHQLAHCYHNMIREFEADKKIQEEMKATLPLFYARLLRAFRGCLKWDQFRYGPMDSTMWLQAGQLYLRAGNYRWLDKKRPMGNGTQTTIEAEYMRLVLFHAASMDRLMPPGIELADQLLAHFQPHFSLTKQVKPDNVYWVDLGKAIAPTRLARLPEVSPTLHFFATANALAAIEAIRAEVSSSQMVPISLGLTNQFPPAAVIALLQHLETFCAPQPPMRCHPRHQVNSWMRVVDGFQSAVAALHGDTMLGGSWAVDEVGLGGMRAQVVLDGNDRLGIGSLVAMCPDGGENWLIGIVRRISRESQTQGNVGIETIGRSPLAVELNSSGLRGEGLLLESALEAGGSTIMLVPHGVWQDFRPVSFELNERRFLLRPLEEQQRGNDFVMARYWVEIQG